MVIQLALAAFGAKFAADACTQALTHGEEWLTLAWTAHGDAKQLAAASQAFLKMLVSIAMAALAISGTHGNIGKGLKIADAIKIQPPGLGMSPAMVTPSGQVIAGGPVFTPGSIASTGPMNIGPNMMAAVGSGGGKITSKGDKPGKAEPNAKASSAEQNAASETERARRNAHLAGKRHPETGIPFDSEGYPDFSGVAIKEVKIQFSGDRRVDSKNANKAANLDETPTHYTWHHHQDGTTMQLVPRNIHRKTGHDGGFGGK